MRHFVLAVAAVVVLGPVAAAKDVTIKWHGQSFFEIKSSAGTTIVIDPHNLEAYGRRSVKADAVLISHFHIDHAALDPIANARSTKIITGLKNKKGKPDVDGLRKIIEGSRREDEFANVDEKVKDVHIRSLGSYHDDVGGMKRGKNSIFILDVDGLRIVHLGDLGHRLHPSTLKKIGKVDVLMVPVGGTYTINGAEAKEVVAQIKPRRYIIPMHYGTAVYRHLVGPEEFLDEQDPKLIKRFKTNELIIDADAVPRKDPVIALLSYEPAEEKSKPKDK
jgi:L-ascorbate metabolism protein UlaG (beta-lactamase superfamily)